jgi:hypothetical protein
LASFQKTPTEADSYADRVINYIPGEIVAAYIFIHSLVMNSGDFVQNNVLQKNGYFLLFIIFLIFIIFTYFYAKETLNSPQKDLQLLIATGAFIVWAFSLGSPFDFLKFYSPTLGQIVVVVYTLGVGVVKPN